MAGVYGWAWFSMWNEDGVFGHWDGPVRFGAFDPAQVVIHTNPYGLKPTIRSKRDFEVSTDDAYITITCDDLRLFNSPRDQKDGRRQ